MKHIHEVYATKIGTVYATFFLPLHPETIKTIRMRSCLCGIFLLLAVLSVSANDKFCIAKDGKTATIIVDKNDWKGVIRAANDLGDDVRKVTGIAAPVEYVDVPQQHAIIAGTIGKSRLIDQLIKQYL